ncbi:hypothetical protein [Halorubrum sp. DTA46]|uniref:hypothetical protein n=1 Tax=Halorubrum sp. DTA46 TaxID=3402162 RepID=UPI003AAE8646
MNETNQADDSSTVAETQFEDVRVHEDLLEYEDEDYLVLIEEYEVDSGQDAHNELACELLDDVNAAAHCNYYVHIRTDADSEDWFFDN